MAGEWLKIEHTTPDKPEVLKVASRLGIAPDEVFGKLFRMWRWFDKETLDGNAPGIGLEAIDHVVGLKGFGECVANVGWLRVDETGMAMPEFAKHCGEGAKRRGLTAWRVAKHAGKTNADSVSAALGEPLARKENGERRTENKNLNTRTVRTAPVGRSGFENSFSEEGEERQEPLDLSAVDWDHVTAMAEALGKRVPPLTARDRRQWLRYCVIAQAFFSEAWLMNAADDVASATERKDTKTGNFVWRLQATAIEFSFDVKAFKAMTKRIEIPIAMWKSKLLEVRKP